MRISDWSSDVCSSDLPGRSFPITAPGGYEWRANGIRGFALTHLSGTGCTGASGDVPIMPVTVPVERSPSSVAAGLGYASLLDHAKESASPGAYTVTLDNRVRVELGATNRTAVGRFTFRSEEHTSELQSLMRISYAVFCLKKKNIYTTTLYQERRETETPIL